MRLIATLATPYDNKHTELRIFIFLLNCIAVAIAEPANKKGAKPNSALPLASHPPEFGLWVFIF
jgi:hypothetical protein